VEVSDAVRRGAAGAERLAPIRGEITRLRAIDEADPPLLVRWLNDPDVRHWLHYSERPNATVGSVRVLYGLEQAGLLNLVWIIETLEGRPVGHVGLLGVDPHHQRAELAITIGEKDAWSRGYGTDAIRTVLRHAFTELGLRRIDLHADADNARGIRCYEKCGFVHEGIMRERRLRYGRPLDMVVMGVLREDWMQAEEATGAAPAKLDDVSGVTSRS
jgi:RimJ/RimL family protein N-acetyltransferase